MSWGKGYRNSGITRIFSYEQALKQFNDTKPIRGRDVECRPLGHRDRPHFSIRLNEQQEVECCEYNHKPSVTFRPNGEVLLNPQWVSVSSCAFIEEVLGIASSQVDYKIRVELASGTFVVPKKDGLVIKRDPERNNNYHPLSVQPNVVHHIKRGVANIVRSQYADVLSYAHGYFKLGATMPSDEEQREMFGTRQIVNEYADGERYEYEVLNSPKWEISNPEDVKQFIDLMRSGEPMDQYKAMVALRIQNGSWRIGKQTYKNVLQVIDRMILVKHRDEVFKEVEVPAGVVRKDIYGWAFEA
jgi:hypothetical protein